MEYAYGDVTVNAKIQQALMEAARESRRQEELQILSWLERGIQKVFISPSGYEMYALIEGELVLFTGEPYNCMTKNQIDQLIELERQSMVSRED